MAISPFLVLRQILELRLERKTLSWLKASSREIADGAPAVRFCALLALASRHARQRTPLAPTAEERAAVVRACAGVEIERWSLLETLRVVLTLSRSDLKEESGLIAIDEAFRYADEGEACALYRAMAFLPEQARFSARVREGCRSNMLSVFEAAGLDTPFPRDNFDELAWNQLAVKALFMGAPLWRLVGLDERGSDDLSRMALDLVEERRSAGRPVQHELWLLLSGDPDERMLDALEAELNPQNENVLGRCGAVFGLARIGQTERLIARKTDEQNPKVALTIADALAGHTDRCAYRQLEA